tara:strand:+ start:114 stop:650 length:537 start_codon:yes stop_codon:yes gene_type:complete
MALTENYMADAPFMTAAEVITIAFTNKNTDTSLISAEIRKIAEIAHIIEPLGRDFYIHLKDAFDAGSETADETTLMTDWIKPTLAWYSRFELILEIQNQSTSSGIVHNIPEFSNVVSASDLNVYKQDTYRKGKVMTEQLVKFLDENSTEFPEYEGGNDSDILCNKNKFVSKTHGMIIY